MAPGPLGLVVEVGVGAVEPVLTGRAEDVHVERVLESLGAVRHTRRDEKDLSGRDYELLVTV